MGAANYSAGALIKVEIMVSASVSSAKSPVHSVHFYDFDEALILRLRSIVSSAIDTGNSVVIVATEDHRRQLVSALENWGVDPRGLEKDGRLHFLDAREMLDKFMVGGHPDNKLFLNSVGKLLTSAKRSAWNSHHGLTVFGEMVAVLWEEGNPAGALELEALWNDLLNDRAFHLHCAYPRHIVNADPLALRAVCESHSHVIGYRA